MTALVRLVVALGSVYLIVWGVTWLTGDLSRAVLGVTDSGGFGFYPGVFLGGLPPIPPFESDLPMVAAVVLGVAGLIALLIDLRRRRKGVSGSG